MVFFLFFDKCLAFYAFSHHSCSRDSLELNLNYDLSCLLTFFMDINAFRKIFYKFSHSNCLCFFINSNKSLYFI